ncbi:MAG: hypothetical protein WC934_02850 [Acidithiobacillus sp.]|jgi:hypothetical protein|uniref:hypothetical protein n=1 Tax=Acidithiobacillus sp. TaxID=1872118 RepID=UPI00355EBC4C
MVKKINLINLIEGLNNEDITDIEEKEDIILEKKTSKTIRKTICKNCGYITTDKMIFCSNCGFKKNDIGIITCPICFEQYNENSECQNCKIKIIEEKYEQLSTINNILYWHGEEEKIIYKNNYIDPNKTINIVSFRLAMLAISIILIYYLLQY